MSTDEFISVAEEVSGESLAGFIGQWLDREGLPQLKPSLTVRGGRKGGWDLIVAVEQQGEPYRFVTHLEVEAGDRRTLHKIEVVGKRGLRLNFEEKPTKVVFDALNDIPVAHDNFYVWQNFIDDFHDIQIVYGTARQIEANHTMARRWQERTADTYIEILPPLVKDAEVDPETVGDHDLMVMGTLADNYFFADMPDGIPVRFGRNHFEWKGETYGDVDDGLFLVVPNPWNSDRVMYVMAANTGMQLWEMTEKYHRGIPQWARVKGGEIVERGFFDRPGFVVTFD